LQGRGYTEDDVERAVSEAAGTDLREWFARHVGGTEDPDFDEALGSAGLRLVRGANEWTIEELPNASADQLRIRQGWIAGRTSR
jgi:predicted metalloprotease with PDZ domain